MAIRKGSSKKRAVSGRQKTAQASQNAKDHCFVIMPFGGWFDTYFVSIYRPAIEAAGLECRRADDLYRPGTVINDIWEYTQTARIVLADLTGKNANVFYELGLAHALAKPAILLAESIEQVPFDLQAIRVLVYDKNEPAWDEALFNNIRTAITEALNSPLNFTLPTFLSVKADSKPPDVTENQRHILELRSDVDRLLRGLLSQSFRTSVEPSQYQTSDSSFIRRVGSLLADLFVKSPDAKLLETGELYDFRLAYLSAARDVGWIERLDGKVWLTDKGKRELLRLG